jgi:flagellar biosynthesis/type III secretory pathway protein FliH
VAGEGKNLSGKPAEGKQVRRENAFQLHYFPEIPLNPTENSRNVSSGAVHQLRPRFVRDSGCTPDSVTGNNLNVPNGSQPHVPTGKTIDDIETEAYIRGFNKGEKAGFDAAGERVDSLQAMLTSAIEELGRIQKQIQQDGEKEIVDLALVVAERIVRQELTANKEAISAIVQEALKKVEHQQSILIRMNPADIQFLDRSQLPFADNGDQPKNNRIRIEADESISRGGCFIETESGDVDARIETQIEIIKAAFSEKIG